MSDIQEELENVDGFDYDEYMQDYENNIRESILLGDYPLKTIMEGITDQFRDYINLEDSTDYVDAFYSEWEMSMKAVDDEDDDYHHIEKKEVLNSIKEEFVAFIFKLFEDKLTLTIMAVDDETTDEDEIEYVVRQLYDYFILNAKKNFSTVITNSMLPKIIDIDDNTYFDVIERLLQDYDPFVRCITPTEFIQYTKNDDILDLFESGDVVGNFLRKYTAKLYRNEEYKMDLITNIVLMKDLKEDILNGTGQQ